MAATFAPLWAAHEFGLFEQYALRTSEPLMINGGPANQQALVARELDASSMAFGPAGAALTASAPIKGERMAGRGRQARAGLMARGAGWHDRGCPPAYATR